MTAELLLLLVGQHLGALHPVEKVLTLALAFGPFVVLGLVIAVRRRGEDGSESGPESGSESGPENGSENGSGGAASRPGPDHPTGP